MKSKENATAQMHHYRMNTRQKLFFFLLIIPLHVLYVVSYSSYCMPCFLGFFLIFWSGMKISLDVDAEEKNMVNTLSRFVMLNKNNSVAVHKFLVEYLHRY